MQCVVFSGGLDSTAALAVAIKRYSTEQVFALSFDYGQRHKVELKCAEAIARRLHVHHKTVSLDGLLHGSALLYDSEVPEGHYADDSMKATVVNGRNLLFAAAAVSIVNEGDAVWFGVHAGDHPIYPDCRPDFWDPLSGVVLKAYGVQLTTPFLHVSKADVVKAGVNSDAPLELTWSCYKGDGNTHCGVCGTCVERKEAFELARVKDPTRYRE